METSGSPVNKLMGVLCNLLAELAVPLTGVKFISLGGGATWANNDMLKTVSKDNNNDSPFLM